MNEYLKRNIARDLIGARRPLANEELAKKYRCSTRQIRKMILLLNEEGFEIENKRSRGYFLASDPKKELIERYVEPEHHYLEFDSFEFRQLYEMGMLFQAQDPLSLQTIADRLFISKSCAKLDMEYLEKELRQMGISIIKSVKGHRLKLKDKDKQLLFLDWLFRKEYPIADMHSLFMFLYGPQIPYIEIFKAVCRNAAAYFPQISDHQIIRLTNFMIIKAYERKDVAWNLQERNKTKEFSDLAKRIEKILPCLKPKINDIQIYYELIFERKPDRYWNDFACEIMKEYCLILQRQYRIELTFEDQDNLKDLLAIWLTDQTYHISHALPFVEDMKRQYIKGYDPALEIRYILEAYGLKIDDTLIVLLAIFFHQKQMKEYIGKTKPIEVILINQRGGILEEEWLDVLKANLDRVRVKVRMMSLTLFNEEAKTLDPITTLVLDHTINILPGCMKNHLNWSIISDFPTGKEIEKIKARTVEMFKDQQRNLYLKDLNDVKEKLSFERINKEDIEKRDLLRNIVAIYHVEKYLVIHSAYNQNCLELFGFEKEEEVFDHGVSGVIVFGVDLKDEAHIKYLNVKNFIVKEIPANFLMQKERKEDVIREIGKFMAEEE